MATAARIGRTMLDANVRPRDSQTVIASFVDFHISRVRHVAIHAHRASRFGGVMVVGWDIVFASSVLVARCTSLVARFDQFQRVRIVTIGATNAFVIHLALDKGSEHVDFVFDLPIVVISLPAE